MRIHICAQENEAILFSVEYSVKGDVAVSFIIDASALHLSNVLPRRNSSLDEHNKIKRKSPERNRAHLALRSLRSHYEILNAVKAPFSNVHEKHRVLSLDIRKEAPSNCN